MNREISTLTDALGQAFDARAWHGTPLRRALRGLTPRQALWRPSRGRHNIWELILHTAYWKYMVRRRLSGETDSFPRPGANWPRLPDTTDARALRQDILLLRRQHERLVATVRRFPTARLRRKGARWTPLEQILGVASHDLYHCGQIQLLKVLQAGR